MRRVLATVATIGCLGALVACGGEAEDPGTESTATASETAQSDGSSPESTDPAGPAPVTIEIKVRGDEISPSGERVEVEAGEPIELLVDADTPGELHVHSSPEQTIEFQARRETFPLEIARPGIVELESHDTGQVIVQLEVR